MSVEHRTACTWRRQRAASPRRQCTRCAHRCTPPTGPGHVEGGARALAVGFEQRVIGAAIVTVLASLVVGFHGGW
jgi:hypothetical protein